MQLPIPDYTPQPWGTPLTLGLDCNGGPAAASWLPWWFSNLLASPWRWQPQQQPQPRLYLYQPGSSDLQNYYCVVGGNDVTTCDPSLASFQGTPGVRSRWMYYIKLTAVTKMVQ